MVRIISANYIPNYISVWGRLTPQHVMLHRKNLEVKVLSKIVLVELWLAGTQWPVMGVLYNYMSTDLQEQRYEPSQEPHSIRQGGEGTTDMKRIGQCQTSTKCIMNLLHDSELIKWSISVGTQHSQCRHHSQSRIIQSVLQLKSNLRT